MFGTIANQSSFVNQQVNPMHGGFAIPTPRGFAAPPTQRIEADGRLFAGGCPRAMPEMGGGVRSAEPVVYQVTVGSTSFIEQGVITVLPDGRVRIGNRSETLHFAGVYRAGEAAVCRYEYTDAPRMALNVLVDWVVVYALWERVCDNDNDLYAMFETMMDGIHLDPYNLTAVFGSQASAVVFGRLFPEYTVFARVEGESSKWQ